MFRRKLDRNFPKLNQSNSTELVSTEPQNFQSSRKLNIRGRRPSHDGMITTQPYITEPEEAVNIANYIQLYNNGIISGDTMISEITQQAGSDLGASQIIESNQQQYLQEIDELKAQVNELNQRINNSTSSSEAYSSVKNYTLFLAGSLAGYISNLPVVNLIGPTVTLSKAIKFRENLIKLGIGEHLSWILYILFITITINILFSFEQAYAFGKTHAINNLSIEINGLSEQLTSKFMTEFKLLISNMNNLPYTDKLRLTKLVGETMRSVSQDIANEGVTTFLVNKLYTTTDEEALEVMKSIDEMKEMYKEHKKSWGLDITFKSKHKLTDEDMKLISDDGKQEKKQMVNNLQDTIIRGSNILNGSPIASLKESVMFMNDITGALAPSIMVESIKDTSLWSLSNIKEMVEGTSYISINNVGSVSGFVSNIKPGEKISKMLHNMVEKEPELKKIIDQERIDLFGKNIDNTITDSAAGMASTLRSSYNKAVETHNYYSSLGGTLPSYELPKLGFENTNIPNYLEEQRIEVSLTHGMFLIFLVLGIMFFFKGAIRMMTNVGFTRGRSSRTPLNEGQYIDNPLVELEDKSTYPHALQQFVKYHKKKARKNNKKK